jgi:hypothetical protein
MGYHYLFAGYDVIDQRYDHAYGHATEGRGCYHAYKSKRENAYMWYYELYKTPVIIHIGGVMLPQPILFVEVFVSLDNNYLK